MSNRFELATTTASSRDCSEDRVAIHPLPRAVVAVVADGAGGISGGAAAADAILHLVRAAVVAPTFDPAAHAWWTTVLQQADREVEIQRDGGETTAVVVCVGEDGLVGATAGDSGALIVHEDGTVTDLTAAQAPYRKRRVGSGRAVPTAIAALLPGRAVLVLATDGLIAYTRHEVIARAVLAAADLQQAAQELVDVVRLPSGALMDDVAIAMVRRA